MIILEEVYLPQIEVSEEIILTSCLFVKVILTISNYRDDSQLVVDLESMQRFLHFVWLRAMTN